jgi:hypothetical protein
MRTSITLAVLVFMFAIGCNSNSTSTALDMRNTPPDESEPKPAGEQPAKSVEPEIDAGMQMDEFERSRKLLQKFDVQLEPLHKGLDRTE